MTKNIYIWNKMLTLKLELVTNLQQMWNSNVSYKSLNKRFLKEMGKHLFLTLEHFDDFQIKNGLRRCRGRIWCRYFWERAVIYLLGEELGIMTHHLQPTKGLFKGTPLKSMEYILCSWETWRNELYLIPEWGKAAATAGKMRLCSKVWRPRCVSVFLYFGCL